VTAPAGRATPAGPRDEDGPAPAWTLVWIDAHEARIGRWVGGRGHVERLTSDVPAHHRATGHVRHDTSVRHGGGCAPQRAGEPRRLEHLARFVERVAGELPEDENLAILGPGTVRDRLAQVIRSADRHRRRDRSITCQACPPITDRQLVARLRRLVGSEPIRGSAGAYRWTGAQATLESGHVLPPRRVLRKPPAALPGER